MEEDLKKDIEQTLNKLTQTAQLIKKSKTFHGFDHEIASLEKTQESLLARLLHRQSLLEMDKHRSLLETIRKEEIARKVIDYAKTFSQKSARSRRARSKS